MKMKISFFHFISLLILVFFFHKALGAIGIDMSLQECANVGLSDWQCLVNKGFSFAIIETWNGGFQYNKNIATAVSNAWSAGMQHVDVYAFLCPNCGGNNPPSSAIQTIYNNLRAQGVNYGMLWFDIEQCDGCWNDFNSNIAFIQAAVNESVRLGMRIGLYSSEYEWTQTVGSSCTAFKNYPLWYAHWDNQQNFNDAWAYNFGGWTSGAIKQYWDGGPSGCSAVVDVNYYP